LFPPPLPNPPVCGAGLCALLAAKMVSADWARDMVGAAVKVITRGSYRILYLFDYVGLSAGTTWLAGGTQPLAPKPL
jgi:hypothetical protein